MDLKDKDRSVSEISLFPMNKMVHHFNCCFDVNGPFLFEDHNFTKRVFWMLKMLSAMKTNGKQGNLALVGTKTLYSFHV